MRELTIEEFLSRLSAREPVPGGGATAGLHAAQAAALLAMVARYSEGPRYAGHAQEIAKVLAEAEALREQAVRAAGDDMAAFAAVAAAYQRPRDSDPERAARTSAIAEALAGAAQPPMVTIAVAERLVALAETLLPIGNHNVITDIAVAAETARAAATAARVNVEVNLAGIADPSVRQACLAAIGHVDPLVARVDRVTAEIRKELCR